MTDSAIRTLLNGLIDYAGLFPPAALSMTEAVANYAAYRDSPDSWALGRLVMPVGRLVEFEESVARYLNGAPWPLSVLAQGADRDTIGAFSARHAGRIVIENVEAKAATPSEVAALAPLAKLATVFVEIPVHHDPSVLVAAIRAHGLRAKIRTGGVTADAFPAAGEVAQFLAECARQAVMFKATAGLHHPLRGDYPLTYAPGAPRGAMFGFLNVFLAAAFVRHGLPAADIALLLDERDTGALRIMAEGVEWRGRLLTTAALAETRAHFAVSFGSCSFREPIDDLFALHVP